jgi:hypothetical protein
MPIPGTDASGFHPHVDCSIGSRIGRCVFDTGLHGLVANSCFAAGERWGSPAYTIGASGQKRYAGKVRIDRLVLGSTLYADLLAQIRPEHDCSTFLGILGIDLFNDRLFIDMRRALLTDENPGIELDQPLRVTKAGMLVPVRFQGKTLTALVDTGALATFIEPAALLRLAPHLPSQSAVPLEARDIHGGAMRIGKIVKAPLEIAGHRIENAVMASTELKGFSGVTPTVDMILGMNIIKELSWGFDLDAGRWGVAPVTHQR